MHEDQKKIRMRAVAGLVFLAIMMGIFLFGSAGSFDYWQAWSWILVFIGSSALITNFLMNHDLALLQRRIGGGPRGEKESVQKKIIGFARCLFIAMLIIPGLDNRFGWSAVPAWLSIAGDIFGLIGFYLIFLVFRENSFTSAVIEIAADQKVVSTGPYKWVRHPMYSGALLMMIFAPLALGSYWGMICVPPFVAIIIWRLLEEEKFLVAHLAGYPEFTRNTIYRLVPGIW